MSNGSTQLHRTACPLDCPDLCALDVTVSDGRVVKLTGADDHPITEGYICRKVRHFPEHAYGPDRLLQPARRCGPKGEARFTNITWEEALGEIAHRINETINRYGGESILPLCYGGSNGKLTQDSTDAQLFQRVGASRLLRTVCAAPTGRAAAGLYGKMTGVGYNDYVHARLIVIWGANPSASGIHLVPFVRRAMAEGAKLVVVDPRSTPLARLADLHLAVRPGTDVAVALSVIRWLFQTGHADKEFLGQHATGVDQLNQRSSAWTFDRAAEVAGVSREDLERFAGWYAESSPAVIRCGWGLERNRSGGSAVAAVLALPAVAGKFGVRGGGYTLSNSGAWQFGAVPQASTRAINMNQVGRVLLDESDPPVQVLFVYNANPLATLPNQSAVRAGLEREDLFTVVFDQVLTDTAKYADVVLPATTFLEHDDLRNGYGSTYLHRVVPVTSPVGSARPNYAVFAELIERLGLSQPEDVSDPDQLIDRLLAGGNSTDVATALADPGWTPAACGPNPIQFVDVLPRTSDQKVHLCPDELDREAPDGLYALRPDPAGPYPLGLISPASANTVSSTLAQLDTAIARLEMHSADAQPRGIADGDRVRVSNEQGEVICHVAVHDGIRPGVVAMPKGLWSRHTFNGDTANVLAPDSLSDLGGGACFNDARVQVEQVPAAKTD